MKDTDVDYVFNNMGFSSTSGLYSLPIPADAMERAEKAIAERTQESASINAPHEPGHDPQAQAQPEIQPPPENFRITDDDLGVGGAKAKFRMNMDASTC